MIKQTVSDLLEKNVTLDIEGIDRIYLNAYQPMLQTGGGIAFFFRNHRGSPVPSTKLMAPMTEAFVKNIKDFAKMEKIDIVPFEKGQRKDDETQERLPNFNDKEGVLYIGVAQEKASTFRVSKRFDPVTITSVPWLSRTTVMCNQYYFYVVDENFGPLFVKFSSYFPYTARINLNGHEYAKKQLEKEGIAFEALDNGILSCENPERLQQILNELTGEKIEAVIRKWFARLPYPFTPEDDKAGFCYDISILQIEFARTQVFDRPVSGRYFFEEIIRENIDLGRPAQVSLIFDRRVTKKTPGVFRTRVITEGVNPSLHVSYKNTKIKQYFKEGRALRTETTINNTRDFGIGRRLKNLPKLREIGFSANRRLLNVQKVSQDCRIGVEVFERITKPQLIEEQRVPSLKFGDARAMALFQALCLFFVIPNGFRNRDLRVLMAQFLGVNPENYKPGKMTYDLRRLRLHGLVEKIPNSHCYRVTQEGLRVALFFTKVHSRILRPGLSELNDGWPEAANRPLASAMLRVEKAIDDQIQEAKLAA